VISQKLAKLLQLPVLSAMFDIRQTMVLPAVVRKRVFASGIVTSFRL